MMVRRITVSVAILLVGAGAWAFPRMDQGGGSLPDPQIGRFRQANYENLGRLEVGMSAEQVSGVMGDRQEIQTYNLSEKAEVLSNPVRVETRSGKDGKGHEVRYYFAYQKKADMKITTDELCPVVFGEGGLAGWGWEYYEKEIGPAPAGP